MKPLKQQRLINDLYCLFIATSFLKIYNDGAKDKVNELSFFQGQLTKECIKHSKYLKIITIKANDIFNECEQELRELINKDTRFSKKISLNESSELEVNGLAFVSALILEQEQLPNRVLNLPYSITKKISLHFMDSKDPIVSNSMILARYFIKKITSKK